MFYQLHVLDARCPVSMKGGRLQNKADLLEPMNVTLQWDIASDAMAPGSIHSSPKIWNCMIANRYYASSNFQIAVHICIRYFVLWNLSLPSFKKHFIVLRFCFALLAFVKFIGVTFFQRCWFLSDIRLILG